MVMAYPTIAHDMVVPAKAYSNRDPRFLKKWRCEGIGVGRREEGGREREEGKKEGREKMKRGRNSEIKAHRMTNLFTNLQTVSVHTCLPFANYTLHRI